MLRAIWFAVYAAVLTLNIWLAPDPLTRRLRVAYREQALQQYS